MIYFFYKLSYENFYRNLASVKKLTIDPKFIFALSLEE